MRPLRWAGSVVLVMVTLVFLASIGGGMLYVWWLLVPLHWLAARGAGPVAAGWWAFLAGACMAEVGMMLAIITTGSAAVALVAAPLFFVATGVGFLVGCARRRDQPASSS